MSTAPDPAASAPTGEEIDATRVFAASPETVFRAFTDPAVLARWWGPRGFTNTFQEFDLRPGGDWRFVMRGPDGTEYPSLSRFMEVTAPERIVLEHLEPVHWFRMTITLTPEAGGTRLTWRMRFASAEETERVRPYVVPANEENFDRLHAVLSGA